MAQRLKFSILGDSVTQCPGINNEEKLRAQLKVALQEGGYEVTLRNHSVTGTTSGNSIARAEWVMSCKPDVVLISLGVNDPFERNLGEIIERLRSANRLR
jgi:acyl-CoA thioesterase-1